MSQNQSFFWHTSRHNVYLKRAAKYHVLLALMAMLSYSTVCLAEMTSKYNDEVAPQPAVTSYYGPDNQMQYDDLASLDAANRDKLMDGYKTQPAARAKNGFIDAFTASISVILFTELGDKTFFIAAIMAMRHPRLIVFAGAISALALMTVLSVVFGLAATIIPKIYTYYISTALFAIFGLKMIYEGYFMSATDAQEEFEEVQSDLRKREDEFLRNARNKFEDDGKRKHSNSDKESDETPDTEHASMMCDANGLLDIKRRQRKQTLPLVNSSNHKHVNNSFNNNNNNNKHGCDTNGDVTVLECHEDNDKKLLHAGNNIVLMPMGHSATPTSSTTTTAATTITQQTNGATNLKTHSSNSGLQNTHNETTTTITKQTDPLQTMVHSNSVASALSLKTNGNVSLRRSNSLGCDNAPPATAAMTTPNTMTITQNGGAQTVIGADGNQKRLEREVNTALVQDPESGLKRKNSKKSAAYLTTRVLMQAFTMTFLAEWGDRSQLTTIVLAAAKDPYGVIVGGILGHSICTGLAVVGGRMVAAKISVRTVTIMGGIVFLGFALYALIARPDDV